MMIGFGEPLTLTAPATASPLIPAPENFHPNHVAIFTGATTGLEEDKNTHFTLGVDYVRRFTESGRLGIGVFGEVIFDKHTE